MPPFVLNIPNSITIFRLLMIPLCVLPLLPIFGSPNLSILIMVNVAFFVATITDFVDGYLARRLNQVSEWGAYMDPLIDKYLIWALYLTLVFIPKLSIPLWAFLIILARDLVVTQMRNYALKQGISFKTSFLAKIKTAIQMIIGSLILLFLLGTFYLNTLLGDPNPYYLDYWKDSILFYSPSFVVCGVAVFTAITGIDYAYILYQQIYKQ
ncbi:MAG: CDP-diacylglycerol--glycerol-3-phosphate 3-phosphatidyltransferase [Brevinema sp.]